MLSEDHRQQTKQIMTDNLRRNLPAVNDVLAVPAAVRLIHNYGHDQTVAAIRSVLVDLRDRLSTGGILDGQASAPGIAERAAALLTRESGPKIRPVINATGVVLHTNLGRAPLAAVAADAARAAASATQTSNWTSQPGGGHPARTRSANGSAVSSGRNPRPSSTTAPPPQCSYCGRLPPAGT